MKATIKNGVICPEEPLPADWLDGTELEVQRVTGAAILESRFRQLKTQWHDATRFHSNPSIIMRHPAMRAIVAMGEAVVPIILRDLQNEPSLMVWTLAEITGENVAPPKVEDGFAKWNIPAATEAWLNWGRAKGLL